VKIEVTEFVDVDSRLKSLGMALPDGFVIMPSNVATAEDAEELVYAESATAIVKLLRQFSGLDPKTLSDPPLQVVHNRDISVYLPLMYISANCFVENREALEAALKVIAEYVSTLLRGLAKGRNLSSAFVLERKVTGATIYERFEYTGPPETLLQVLDRMENGDARERNE